MHIHKPLLILAACLLVTATANNGIPADSTVPQMITPAGALLDSYIEFYDPNIYISKIKSGRDGRTTLTVTLGSRAQVSKHMPVVSPQVQGTTMDILDTWDALKNVAAAFKQAKAASQSSPGSPPLFPSTSKATRLASVAPPPNTQASALAADTPPGGTPHSLVEFPPSLMLMPFGQSTAAIADVLDLVYDDQTGAITMQLDVVHNPVIFSQFQNHGPSSWETDKAHYHFATRPGMEINAQALLQNLKDFDYKPAGLHVFLKTEALPEYSDNCLSVTLDPYKVQCLTAGPRGTSSLNISISVFDACRARPPGADGPLPALDGTAVFLTVSDPGEITYTSDHPASTLRPPRRRPPPAVSAETQTLRHFKVAYTKDGVAEATVRAFEAGTFVLRVYEVVRYDEILLDQLAVKALPDVELLVLVPGEALPYMHVGGDLELTALAVSNVSMNSSVPVEGADISFAAYGDCKPGFEPDYRKLTNYKGQARVALNSEKSGAVAVVAAARTCEGVVLSEPLNVMFFSERSYGDRREEDNDGRKGGEEEYYGRKGGDHRPLAIGGHYDAKRNEAEAARLAKQRALDDGQWGWRPVVWDKAALSQTKPAPQL